MGLTKSNEFTEHQNQFALLFKALGHPARIAIIQHLIKVNRCICGDIVHELPLAQPTVSQHLKELKNAGLIKGTIEGTSICYCIDEKKMEVLQKFFDQVLYELNQNKSNCC